jgi:predicted secreted Zn-dependent protease
MVLRAGCAALLACAAAIGLAGSAEASVKVKIKTVSYTIKGKTAEELLAAMDRKGPRQGFTARAIAQTGYTVAWDIDWREQAGSCRVVKADAVLDLRVEYPGLGNGLSPDLSRRWNRFMAGVHKHEETHQAIAREMVNVAARQVSAISFRDDKGCRKTQAEIKRRIAATYAQYEAKQVKFDEVEHSEGGNVEHLINRLGG